MKRTLLVRLWRNERGVTAVELALLAAFVFVPLLLGATELGHRLWIMAQIDTAARAGIEYAMIHSTTDPAKINTAATSATGLTVTATSSSFFGCPTATGVTPQASGSTCSDGGTTANYVSVTAAALYTPLFHSCGGLLPATICPLNEAAISLASTATSRITEPSP